MAMFDPSPRAAKRRKVALDEDSTPIYSRVLRTVTQAVYGKSSRSRAGSRAFNQEFGTPVKDGKDVSGGSRSVDDTDGGEMRVDHTVETSPLNSAETGRRRGVESTASRINYGNHGRGTTSTGDDGKGRAGASNGVSTPTKKRARKYKGWVYAEDGDGLSPGDGPGGVGDLGNGVGRHKRGRDDLTIDINPRQLQPRRSLGAGDGMGAAADGADVGLDDKARRTSARTRTKAREIAVKEPPVGSSISSKKSRGYKVAAAEKTSPQALDSEATQVGTLVPKDASLDRLAQESDEESTEATSAVISPSKPNRKRRIRSESPVDDEPSPVTGKSILFDKDPADHATQINLSSHAQALQKMLHERPQALAALKTNLLSGLTGRRRLPLLDIDDEMTKVKQLIEQTVLAGEGNSMLLIGSRGSGKTSVVENVVTELSANHDDDFHVVRLNGFIHTDDKLALREIWRQLGREMDVDNDDLGVRSNYADSLTSLLALLAHPTTEEDNATTARSVVFILDEFDLFASHPRQTLLYNLFDVAQSRNAPIAVLGLTTKVNVVDTLEKRVKSRFGQRYVHLSLPRTFKAFQDICLSALTYRPSTHDILQHPKAELQTLAGTWNTYISTLFPTPELQHLLHSIYLTTKSIPAFLSASILAISTLNPTSIPTALSFTSTPLLPPDSKLSLLPSLSTLALALLIAAARLDIILDTDVCTFAMAYEEYVSLASKSKLQSSAAGMLAVGAGSGARVWGTDVARGKWEELAGLELVLPVAGGGRGGGARGEMWRVDVGLEEIGGWLDEESGRGGALGRWCREI